jgi:hypothetical protein
MHAYWILRLLHTHLKNVHVYICTSLLAFAHTRKDAHTQIYTHKTLRHTHVHTYADIYIHRYTHTRTHTRAQIYVNMTDAHTHKRKYVHMHKFTYTHTRLRTSLSFILTTTSPSVTISAHGSTFLKYIKPFASRYSTQDRAGEPPSVEPSAFVCRVCVPCLCLCAAFVFVCRM